MTAHNNAKKGEISKIVLMPGDPLRAKWIAENFLINAKLVNEVRGMLAYSGTYKNKNISVMGHGMGIPSIGIYSCELFDVYDVDVIIRVGSAGSYVKNINIGDLVLAKDCYSESTFAENIGIKSVNNKLSATKEICDLIIETSKEINVDLTVATVHSSDVFYGSKFCVDELIQRSKSDVVEMESFGLYANAIKLNKKAATLLTCSDSLVTHEAMTANERQVSFKKMIVLALETAIKL